MKKNRSKLKFIFLLIIFLSFNFLCFSQSPIGAWERYYEDESGTKIKSVVIFSEKFQSIVMFNAESGEFIYSNGGTWKLNGDMMTEKVEFDTKNSERVGDEVTFRVDISKNTLSIPESNWIFKRIDDGKPGELFGAWLMSGRYRNGEKQIRDTDKPRKTMKILSGTRFQWIAYDTEKKEFKGTGGGTYTTSRGKYSETIEFFSRDNSKVGINLQFNYNLENGEWTHKGKTSKGAQLHEIWTTRKK